MSTVLVIETPEGVKTVVTPVIPPALLAVNGNFGPQGIQGEPGAAGADGAPGADGVAGPIVTDEDVEITAWPKGLILPDEDGKRWKYTANTDGTLQSTLL